MLVQQVREHLWRRGNPRRAQVLLDRIATPHQLANAQAIVVLLLHLPVRECRGLRERVHDTVGAACQVPHVQVLDMACLWRPRPVILLVDSEKPSVEIHETGHTPHVNS